ncbi:MAG: DUF1294 domain-containing protein [Acutalibacteraceae bacterium]|nr:DUF1294 domain-containing protein [Acutalibacteraceae bacterium]
MDFSITAFIIIYLIIINVIAIIVTITDKVRAVYKKWRITEKTLFLLSALGGAVGMYITMHIIHHKTKKPQFMIGIPAIFIAELLLFLIIYNGVR